MTVLTQTNLSNAVDEAHPQGAGGIDLATVKADVDIADALTKKHTAGSDNQDLSGKVDKIIDYSLVVNTEIAKIHANTNDPTADQKAALAGTNGTPSITNKLVTDTDPRNTNARTPSTHSHVPGDVTGTAVITADSRLSDNRTPIDGSATNTKLANMATKTYKGRTAGTTGMPEDVAVATLKADLNFAKADVGLGSVDNTTDVGKPVSTAQQTALDLKANITSSSLITPNIGVATGTSLAVTDKITSSGTAGIGYATGAGGTITQATSKSTGVTLNKLCGTITMNGAALAAATIITFTVTNTLVAATDSVCIQHDSVGTIGGYTIMPNTMAEGSFKISVRNNTAASLSQAIVLRFAIIKAVAA